MCGTVSTFLASVTLGQAWRIFIHRKLNNAKIKLHSHAHTQKPFSLCVSKMHQMQLHHVINGNVSFLFEIITNCCHCSMNPFDFSSLSHYRSRCPSFPLLPFEFSFYWNFNLDNINIYLIELLQVFYHHRLLDIYVHCTYIHPWYHVLSSNFKRNAEP